MGMTQVPVGEVVHFSVACHTTAGAESDADSAPTFDVFEEASDTAMSVPGTATEMTKRGALTGRYRGTFTASSGNGFEAGKWYDVICSATVGSTAGNCIAMNFRCTPAEASAGIPDVNTMLINDSSGAASGVASAGDNYSATRGLTGTAVPAVASGSSGAVLISGSNAGTTTLGALTVTGTTTHTGTTVHTGHVSYVDGIEIAAPSTGGRDGFKVTGSVSGHGINATGGSAGHGISGQGNGAASGIAALGGASSGYGIRAVGYGTGDGISAAANGSGEGFVAGSVVVSGTTTLTGNVSCGDAFDVVGALTAGSVSIDGGFDVVGALSCNSLLVDTTTALTGAVTAADASNNIVGVSADVLKWDGTAVAGPGVAGVPDVNVQYVADVAVSTAGTVDPSDMLLSAEIATVNSQTSVTLATGSDVDSTYLDAMVVFYDDTNSDYPSVRYCTAYTGATKTLVVNAAPDFTVGADDSVKIFATHPALVDVLDDTGTTLPATLTTAQNDLDTITGTAGVLIGSDATLPADIITAASINTGAIAADAVASTALDNVTAWTTAITGDITGNLSGSVGSVSGAVGSVSGAVGSVTGAVGSVAGNVDGNVSGSVASVATGGITAASIANAAIDAATFAADVDAEILSYIVDDATRIDASSVNAVEGKVDTLDTLTDKVAPILVGTVTGGGTGTEVFTYGGVTVTVTVDDDGNRSVVAFS